MIKLPEPFIQYEGCKPMFTEAQLKQAVRDAYEDAAKHLEYDYGLPGSAELVRALIKEIE